jgi:MFS family permease
LKAIDSLRLATVQERKRWSVLRVCGGNFLEMYDFMVFGYYAAAIGRAFFPSRSSFLTLMLSLATFGSGFLMRPIGAVVLGSYSDRHGRRAGLLLTLGLMAIGISIIALTPPYASIGALAPLLIVAGRLLQGFSAGMELGGVSVYLSEIATPGHKGFYVSWQSCSQQVAVMAAAAVGVVLTATLTPAELERWGWRVPMLLGCAIVPLLWRLRRSLQETRDFTRRSRQATRTDITRSLRGNWRVIAIGAMLATTTTVSFYLITAYTPTFGSSVLHLATRDTLIVTLCVGASNLLWLPLMGALSDRVGRRPILVTGTVLMLATVYPVMAWLVRAPSFDRLLAVELWLSLLYGAYNGAMVVYLTEIMPVDVRTTGFALAYSLATALFGGFTPAVCTYLVHATHNRAVPGLWLSVAAFAGLTGTILAKPRTAVHHAGQ